GGWLAAGGGGARVRGAGQPQHAPRRRRAAVLAGPPALGVRLPARVRGVPQPDRALVEGPALARLQGPALRDVGRAGRRRGPGHRPLAPPPAPPSPGAAAGATSRAALRAWPSPRESHEFAR